MAVVRLPPPALTILADETAAASGEAGDRLYRDIVFAAEDGATIPVTVSLPRTHDGTPLPVFAILGGLTSGKRALVQVPDPGPNILVSIGYPADAAAIEDGTWPQRVAAARAAARRTPPAVAAVAQWLHAQSWADRERISEVDLLWRYVRRDGESASLGEWYPSVSLRTL